MRWWVRGDLCNEGLRGEQMKMGKEEGMGKIRKTERREGEERGKRRKKEISESQTELRCWALLLVPCWLVDRQTNK